MLIANQNPDHGKPLDPVDANMLGPSAALEVERFLQKREGHKATPLVSLPQLAGALRVSSIHMKDEGHRLGLGSFKALGGAYAVIRLIVEEASKQLGREIDIADFNSPDVRNVASQFTVACATDGNHGRSVAQGAQLIGARCVIFVHSGVSDERVAAIARYGARIVHVAGNYDDSVAEAAQVAEKNAWVIVSDTSWPGYERIPGLVMQGYTALLSETLKEIPQAPTHVFVQAGVGGIAAAAAAYFSEVLGDKRPYFVVVDPSKAACLFESARVGRPIKVDHGEPTIMAMLECYEPSLVAWRILSRIADAFMTVEDSEAVDAMKRLAYPLSGDPAIVAGESGGVGLAALSQVARLPELRKQIGLNEQSRVFLINTEGATDPVLYEKIVGRSSDEVSATNAKVAA
ncbi:diaminopropionate ammonia-lyase [Bosea lathyri]|uniref:Diaminopropionate ammonia-lyase n=1 Tax=Bosea lathyri TaxID=1036778 RepID=A0A1H6CAC8_9HYPH|nr:diaminopropionate ammonia-lyase [Bosea lathyri]SEG69862.1 diaminopropionate ammonia-lyase [Bosea lathyri]